jgi:hypothetical protein
MSELEEISLDPADSGNINNQPIYSYYNKIIKLDTNIINELMNYKKYFNIELDFNNKYVRHYIYNETEDGGELLPGRDEGDNLKPDDRDRFNLLFNNFNNFLSKPIELKEIIRIISDINTYYVMFMDNSLYNNKINYMNNYSIHIDKLIRKVNSKIIKYLNVIIGNKNIDQTIIYINNINQFYDNFKDEKCNPDNFTRLTQMISFNDNPYYFINKYISNIDDIRALDLDRRENIRLVFLKYIIAFFNALLSVKKKNCRS